MADISSPPKRRFPKIDGAWAASIILLIGAALLVPTDFTTILNSAVGNILHTGIFIAFAVLLIAYLRATGAETVVGKAFQGNEYRMILLASLVGGLMPFCSCEVIPFIAALLAVGTPLSAVMAFWLSSPIMDPPMFLITASGLGWDFAIAKTVAAVGMGLFGGLSVKLISNYGFLPDPLKDQAPSGCGSCCGSAPKSDKPLWRFWTEHPRLVTFKDTAIENALFLLKWLTLAYIIEALMIQYVPAAWIAGALGGNGFGTIVLGAVIGAPAYLNGYAAVPLLSGLLEQGMGSGVAMSFLLAGSVSSIPAAMAVWALVKPRVFVTYLGLGISSAIIGGLIWSIVA
ncbi:MAG: permease [Pseudomonadota bacterium]